MGSLALLLSTLTIAAPESAATDWPMARANGANTGATRLAVSTEPRAWTFEGSERAWGYELGMTVWTSPAIGLAGESALLVIGSYDRNLYALDAASGEPLWSYATGGSLAAAPVLWRDDERLWVFATSSDRLLYALDAVRGERIWIHSVESFRTTLGGARLASPCVGRVGERDAVFFGHWVWDRSLSRNQQEGGVTALAAQTGEVLWRRSLGDNEITAAIYAETDGGPLVLVGSSDGNLYALAARDGRVRWRQTELDAIRGPPAVVQTTAGTRVVLASKSGVVRAVAAESGEEIWRFRTGNWVTGAPAVATIGERQMVFVGSYDHTLYGLDLANGDQIWRYATRGSIFGGPVVIGSGAAAQVAIPSWDHYLHGVRAEDGEPLWQLYTGRPIWSTVGLEHTAWSSPVAAELNGEWMVYFGSYSGTLHGLELADLVTGSSERGRQNLFFWLSFPVTLVVVFLLARGLTLWDRRRSAGAQPEK